MNLNKKRIGIVALIVLIPLVIYWVTSQSNQSNETKIRPIPSFEQTFILTDESSIKTAFSDIVDNFYQEIKLVNNINLSDQEITDMLIKCKDFCWYNGYFNGITADVINDDIYLHIKYSDTYLYAKFDDIDTRHLALPQKYAENNNYINDILDEILTENMTDYEKELAIYDFLVSTLSELYDENTHDDNHYKNKKLLAKQKQKLLNTVDFVSSQDSKFASLFFIMMNKAGIRSMIIEGEHRFQRDDSHFKPHCWNVVQIEDRNYMVDIESAVLRSMSGETIEHMYLNFFDEHLENEYHYNRTKNPICNHTSYHYYFMNNKVVKNLEEIDAIVKKAIETNDFYKREGTCILPIDVYLDFDYSDDIDMKIRDEIKKSVQKYNQKDLYYCATQSTNAGVFTLYYCWILPNDPAHYQMEFGKIIGYDVDGNDYSKYGENFYHKHEGIPLDIIIPEEINGNTVTSIADGVFAGKNIRNVSMPDSIRHIGEHAFSNNILENITLSSSLKTIGDCAFYNNHLTEITFPDSICFMGNNCFQKNHLQGTIVLPKNLIRIEEGCFADNGIDDIKFSKNTREIGNGAFYNNEIDNLTIPSTIEVVEEGAFGENPLNNLTIENPNLTILKQNK